MWCQKVQGTADGMSKHVIKLQEIANELSGVKVSSRALLVRHPPVPPVNFFFNLCLPLLLPLVS